METAIRTANASALQKTFIECGLFHDWAVYVQLTVLPSLLFDLLGFTTMLNIAIHTSEETFISGLIRWIRRARRLPQRRHHGREEKVSGFGQDDERDQEQDDRRDRQPEAPREEIGDAKVGRPSALLRCPGAEPDDFVDAADETDACAGVEAFHVGAEDVGIKGDVREDGASEVGFRRGEFV